MFFAIILFFVFFLFSFDKNNFFVKNKPLNSTNSNIYNTFKNERKRKLEDNNFQQIKIMVDSKCLIEGLTKTNFSLTIQTIIKNSIERAKNTLEKLIKVKKIGKINFK